MAPVGGYSQRSSYIWVIDSSPTTIAFRTFYILIPGFKSSRRCTTWRHRLPDLLALPRRIQATSESLSAWPRHSVAQVVIRANRRLISPDCAMRRYSEYELCFAQSVMQLVGRGVNVIWVWKLLSSVLRILWWGSQCELGRESSVCHARSNRQGKRLC